MSDDAPLRDFYRIAQELFYLANGISKLPALPFPEWLQSRADAQFPASGLTPWRRQGRQGASSGYQAAREQWQRENPDLRCHPLWSASVIRAYLSRFFKIAEAAEKDASGELQVDIGNLAVVIGTKDAVLRDDESAKRALVLLARDAYGFPLREYELCLSRCRRGINAVVGGQPVGAVVPGSSNWMFFPDPSNGKTYHFKSVRDWELWMVLWPGGRWWSFDDLMNTVETWKGKGIEDDAVGTALTSLRKYWRRQGRRDYAIAIREKSGHAGYMPNAEKPTRRKQKKLRSS